MLDPAVPADKPVRLQVVLKAWIVVVSIVVGALSGFVIDFLWVLGPWPSSLKWAMVACAIIGGLLAVSFLLPWPWQYDDGD